MEQWAGNSASPSLKLSITGIVYDTTGMSLDEIRHQTPVCLQRLDGMYLIVCHKEAVAFYIGTEDCSELACDFFVVVEHVVRSPSSGLWVARR